MLSKPPTCFGCSLYGYQQGGFSRPEGNCTNGVMIIGEALGSKEKQDGLPLRPYAESGSVLQTVFRRLERQGVAQTDRLDFLLWNLIACQPPNNLLENMPYEESSIIHCRVHFQEVLKKYYGKIKCILALGNLPLRYLCPEIGELVKNAKAEKNKKQLKKLGSTSLRGYTFNSILGIPIVSTIHPSFIARGERLLLHVLKRDVFHAMQIAKGIEFPFKHDYILDPTLEQANEFYEICRRNSNLAISYDIETPDTILETDETEIEYENIEVRDINSIQFSCESGKGIFLSWDGADFTNIAAKILSLPNTKLGWNNWRFDQTNLEYHLGKGCVKGLNLDLMWEWKHANPDFVKVGRALQFAANFFAPELPAWKHRSESDPKEYGCIDVDSVKRIDNGLTPTLKNKRFLPETKSLYEGYIDDIVNLRPILLDMTARGLPIDMEAREEMRKMLVSEIRKTNKAIQELYPFQLRKVTPSEGYKFVPKEITDLTIKFNELYRKPNTNGSGNQYIIFGDAENYQKYLARYIEQNSRVRQSRKRDGTVVTKEIDTTGLVLHEFNIAGEMEKRWCRMEKYKPGSPQQTIKYIEYKGYKVPTTRDFRKGDKPTTTKDKISELFDSTGDKLFEYIVYARELRKLKSTYVDSKRKGWVVSKDNRIHADFLPIPATGQLSSKIHNAPARGTRFSSPGYKELANQFRKTICAGAGKLLLSGDWSAFHALTLGFEAEDAEYMRLVRLDVHSYVAAYILAEELPMKFAKVRAKKPDKLTHEAWIAKVAKYEETLNRLKNLQQWLALSDEELGGQLKWIKKNFEFTRNSQAKPAILGMGFGMREHKFYKLNRYSFPDVKACEKLIEIIRNLFPKTFVDFHKNILERADRDEYLISRYGYIRWFNDVFDWRLVYAPPKSMRLGERLVRSKGRLYHVRQGNDTNKAIAFLPANDAFGKKKEAMRDLWEYQKDGIIRNYVREFGLVNEIHDDLTFEVDEDKVEIAAGVIKEVMSRPARYLKNSVAPEGLITQVEMKYGRNWGPFHETNNPDGMKELKI